LNNSDSVDWKRIFAPSAFQAKTEKLADVLWKCGFVQNSTDRTRSRQLFPCQARLKSSKIASQIIVKNSAGNCARLTMLRDLTYNGEMNPAGKAVPATPDVCRVCRTRIAARTIPFYCAKSSEMRAGLVPIYSFSTPVCEACIEERTARRKRNYWRAALASFAMAFSAIFIAVWKSAGSDPAGKSQGGAFQVALLIATFAGGVVLFFALIISIQVCSSRFVETLLAVKDKQKELTAAGYTGFWNIPPKNLTIRR
jgi:hypothetical protein